MVTKAMVRVRHSKSKLMANSFFASRDRDRPWSILSFPIACRHAACACTRAENMFQGLASSDWALLLLLLLLLRFVQECFRVRTDTRTHAHGTNKRAIFRLCGPSTPSGNMRGARRPEEK